MENCCLCLESLDTKPPLQTLTCGHKIHYRCYCRLCYHKATFYIECPLCRSKNYKFDRPYNNPKFNLLYFVPLEWVFIGVMVRLVEIHRICLIMDIVINVEDLC